MWRSFGVGVMLNRITIIIPCLVFTLVVLAGDAFADYQQHWQIGKSQPWQAGLQTPGSPVMERIDGFNDFILIIQAIITIFVLSLLATVVIRFGAKYNKVPSKRSHNTALEVVWTLVPVIILLIIMVPSMRLLYFMDKTPNADMTLKVISNQWFWSYEYPDHGNFTFDSTMLEDDELKEGQPRLLETDNRVVLPVGTNIRVLLTSSDVIHSWAVPSLGLKTDTVPGRINETWVRIDRKGIFYGQCSELCGVNHAFMPIAVQAVSKEEFQKWVEKAKKEFASVDAEPLRVAQTETAGR